MNWIKNLFHWCSHNWVIYKEDALFVDGVRRGTLYTLRCSKCGEITCRRVQV